MALAPGASPRVALLAEGAAQGNEGRRPDVDRVSAQGDGLGYIAGASDSPGDHDGGLVANTFLPQSGIY